MSQNELNTAQLNLEEENNQLPSMLNVLTILTLVGSGIFLLLNIYNYFNVCETVELMKSREMPEVGGAIGKMVESAVEISIKQCESRLLILVTEVVTLSLCILGALFMRQRKKQGFIIYVLGELLGPCAMLVIIGGSATSSLMMISGLVIAIVFVILYTTQRKYLVN